MTTTTEVPLCEVCNVDSVIVDIEEGIVSFYSTCGRCFALVAAAPHCHVIGCDFRTKMDYQTIHNPAGALYWCPSGHGLRTAVDWATEAGRYGAERDIEGPRWLLDVRLSDRGIAGGYDAEHPVRRAYARAYVNTARRLLAEREAARA